MPAGQAALSQDWLRSENGVAVAPLNAPWPDRCVKCNAPAGGYRLKQSLYWHPAWVYLLILPGVLIYAIVAAVIRKPYVGHVGVCPKHRTRRTVLRTAGVFLVLASLGSCAAGLDSTAMMGTGVLGVIAGLVLVQLGQFVVRPKKITDAYAWLKCGKAFIASLPPAGMPASMSGPPPGYPHGGGYPPPPPGGMPPR